MTKDFQFDNIYFVNMSETSVNINFVTVRDNYALVIHLYRHLKNGDKCVLISIRDCINNGLSLYNDYENRLTLSNRITKTEDTYSSRATNDNVFKASVMLEAYEDPLNKRIPVELINKWYEISTLLMNKTRFKVSLNNGAYEYL